MKRSIAQMAVSVIAFVKLVVDFHGNFLTAFVSDEDGSSTANFKRYIIGSGWQTTKVLSTEKTEEVYDLNIAVGPSGNVVSVWSQYNSDQFYKTWGIVF